MRAPNGTLVLNGSATVAALVVLSPHAYGALAL